MKIAQEARVVNGTEPSSEICISVGAGTRYKFVIPVDMVVEDLTSSTPSVCEPVQLELNTVTSRLLLDPNRSNNYAYFECVELANSSQGVSGRRWSDTECLEKQMIGLRRFKAFAE